MKKVSTVVKKSNEDQLKHSYMDAYQNKEFKNYVENLDASDGILMKYTSRLEDAVKEHHHCPSCNGLEECPNLMKGRAISAIVTEEGLQFSYIACPFLERMEKQLAYQKNIKSFDLPKEIRLASFKETYTDDTNRLPVVRYLRTFINEYKTNKNPKGLYLYGSFGSGKTYLVAAMFNELAKNDVSSAMVYYPELLRSLKASFGTDYEEKFDFIKRVPLLLLDDIGAENTTAWSRDEVLGPILQYRMEAHLPTFFTSNLRLEELEKNLSSTTCGIDKIKAKRIIERIEQLTETMKLVSSNRRH